MWLASEFKTNIKRNLLNSPGEGLEPTTQWLTVICSTDWAIPECITRGYILIQKHISRLFCTFFWTQFLIDLPRTGLEPAHLTAPGSKPGVSTNSTISAQLYVSTPAEAGFSISQPIYIATLINCCDLGTIPPSRHIPLSFWGIAEEYSIVYFYILHYVQRSCINSGWQLLIIDTSGARIRT